jgi:hypothetical protein
VHRQRAYVGGWLQSGAALVVICLAVVTLPPRSTAQTVAGCHLVGCSVISRLPLRSRAVAGVMMIVLLLFLQKQNLVTDDDDRPLARLCRPGARSGLPCPVPACCCLGCLARAGSGSHSRVELCLSRTGKGSLGGRNKGVV